MPVQEHEEQIQAIMNEGLSYFETNLPGPILYCSMYNKYDYILLGKAKNKLLESFNAEFFPPLKVSLLEVLLTYKVWVLGNSLKLQTCNMCKLSARQLSGKTCRRLSHVARLQPSGSATERQDLPTTFTCGCNAMKFCLLFRILLRR